MLSPPILTDIRKLLARAGVEAEVTVALLMLAGIERVRLERNFPHGTRYLRITRVPYQDRTWDYEILGGEYGHADRRLDFDGRRGGDAAYTVDVVRRWLIDLAPWSEIAIFEPDR